MSDNSKYAEMIRGFEELKRTGTQVLTAMILLFVSLAREGPCFCQSSKDGMTRQLDLKVFYFRNLRQEINDGFNVVQLVPKISDPRSRISLYVPIGIFQELTMQPPTEKESKTMMFLSPRILACVYRKDQFEVCLGVYSEIMMQKGNHGRPFCGLTSGVGWGNDARNIYIRLEIGYDVVSACCRHPEWNLGITFAYRLSPIGRNRAALFIPNHFQASLTKAVETRNSAFYRTSVK
jgi:hypothetical protein